jgi:low affinity Fe/Cu permease
MRDLFHKFAAAVSRFAGSPWAFIGALLVLILWALSGPLFGFSDTWQLVINTSTTIITFLMVFLIQNMQLRDSKEINLKIDELIRSIREARNDMLNLEDLSEEELDSIKNEFQLLVKRENKKEKKK